MPPNRNVSVGDDGTPGAQAPASTLHAEPIDPELMQFAGLAALRLTPEGVVDCCNPVAERLFGSADGSGPGRSFADHVTEQPKGAPNESLSVALGAGRTWVGRFLGAPRGPNAGQPPRAAHVRP